MIPDIIRNVNNIFLKRPKCSLCNYELFNPLQLDDCGHIFCFTCTSLHNIKNTKYCPICKTQSIKSSLLPCNYCKKSSFDYVSDNRPLWSYEGRNYGWWLFNFENNDEIEVLYQHYMNYIINDIQHKISNLLNDNKTNKQIKQDYKMNIFKEEYKIDFENMKQISISHTDRWRNIKRINDKDIYNKMYIKGIAGYSFI